MTTLPDESLFGHLLVSAQRVRSSHGKDQLSQLAESLVATSEFLSEYGDKLLSANRSWREVGNGAAALAAASRLKPASFAIRSMEDIPETANAVRTALKELAAQLVVSALDTLGPLAFAHDAAPRRGTTGDNSSMPKLASPGQLKHLDAMDNIATYHREHERYYTVDALEHAAGLAREANKLKVLVDVWLAASLPASRAAGTDFSDPAFRAVGCADLNALAAIASIGILFMEGQGEPAEIGALKAKLVSLGTGMAQSGKWLADMMVAAWSRESTLLSEEFSAAALPRYQTIATNWVGAQEMALVGRLLSLANAWLGKVDFSPASLRANRKEHSERLEVAARIMDAAMRLQAKSGVDLSRNDECWSEYRKQIKALASRDR
jgi:hypothetical protein